MSKRARTKMRNAPLHHLREWRDYRHLSQETLAERMGELLHREGFDHSQLSKIENGGTRIHEDHVDAACKVLGIEPGALWSRPDAWLAIQRRLDLISGMTDEQLSTLARLVSSLK